MEIHGVHHVQITVAAADVAAARHFYCDILRLPEVPKPMRLRKHGGFWLQVGDRQVHVGVEEKQGETKAHVAYYVSDLTAWRTRLVAHGVMVKDSTPIPGFNRFEFRDPFNNRVELIESAA